MRNDLILRLSAAEDFSYLDKLRRPGKAGGFWVWTGDRADLPLCVGLAARNANELAFGMNPKETRQ